ncbi:MULTISPECIES: DUF1330 domain-containing protein [Streptomyces]|uniref:DUF1330 domain-containing protein n=1 Tax=Streptomyces TaxID=1883 RepID=UPI00167A1D45|nr:MULTISPECIES: DUF1330 domain-containing protein [Streptomyces]MBD3575588.1 DUF1330 domain-containing protein [Streptomyces sp. KD18]GGT21743.1 hypothetical protein GCM10010286_54030 [Streptomyces toxytricini]
MTAYAIAHLRPETMNEDITVVIIGFPDIERARAWYASEAYQAILPLRTNHMAGEAVLVEGVPADYDATKTAADLRAEAGLSWATGPPS